tara:strand:+ start:28623 stop:29009 length:387 start_codon:yes stop_codon:yes gene_type:complete
MANNTINFDPSVGTPYGVNLTINKGADFKSTFKVINNDRSDYNLTGYSGSSQMVKTTALGSTSPTVATFTVGITSANEGEFNLSLGSTATRNIRPGRYEYNILMGTASTVYALATGNILVIGGASSAP